MEKIRRYPAALIITGSDSSRIQTDMKTFSFLGVLVSSAITTQNTAEVRAAEVLSPEIEKKQLTAILDNNTFDIVKTGLSGIHSHCVDFQHLRITPN